MLKDIDPTISNSEAELLKEISEFEPTDILLNLAEINAFLNEEHYQLTGEKGKEIISQFLEKKTQNKVYALVERGVKFLPRHGILALMELCIENPSQLPRGSLRVADNRNKFGLLLLRIMEHTEKDFENKHTACNREEQKELIRTYLTRLQYFNGSAILYQALARYWVIYTECFKKLPEFWPTENPFDFSANFEKEINLSLEKYMALSFSILGRYLNPNGRNFRLTEQFFGKRPDDMKNFGNGLLEDLSQEVENGISLRKEINYYQVGRIWQKPLLRFKQNGQTAYYPLDITFLSDKLTVGIYWQLFDRYLRRFKQGDLTAKEPLDNLPRSFGHAFELYAEDTIKRIHDQLTITPKKLISKVKEVPSTSGADIILQSGTALFLFEITKERIKHETLIKLEPKELSAAIKKLFIGADGKGGKITQLVSSLEMFENSKLDINPSDIKNVFPVIVFETPMPLDIPEKFPFFNNFITEMLAESKICHPSLCRLQVISIGDLELIEALVGRGKTIEKLFLDKILFDSVENNCSKTSWKTFLSVKHSVEENPYLSQKYFDDFGEKARALLFGKKRSG